MGEVSGYTLPVLIRHRVRQLRTDWRGTPWLKPGAYLWLGLVGFLFLCLVPCFSFAREGAEHCEHEREAAGSFCAVCPG